MAADAGWGRISFLSVLSGTLVAFGAFAVIAAVTAAVLAGLNVDTDLSTEEWRQAGFAAAAVMAVVQFLAYLFGGYVAGRMARRSGAMNGVMVFFVGLLIAMGVAALVNGFADADAVERDLRDVGVPTTWDDWRDVGAIAGIASLAAMLLGSVIGGIKGERWHGKLLARAWDPEVGDGVPVAPASASQHVDLRDDARITDDGTSTSVISRRDRDDDADVDADVGADAASTSVISRRDRDDDDADADADVGADADADDRPVLDRDTTLDEDYAKGRGARS